MRQNFSNFGGENMIFKWCRSLYNDYICILYEYEIISRECTSVCNSNYIKKNILWKHSVMILNGSWKWEKDKFKKKSVTQLSGLLLPKKVLCAPPPPFCIKLCLPSFLFTSNESMTPSIWLTYRAHLSHECT